MDHGARLALECGCGVEAKCISRPWHAADVVGFGSGVSTEYLRHRLVDPGTDHQGAPSGATIGYIITRDNVCILHT